VKYNITEHRIKTKIKRLCTQFITNNIDKVYSCTYLTYFLYIYYRLSCFEHFIQTESTTEHTTEHTVTIFNH